MTTIQSSAIGLGGGSKALAKAGVPGVGGQIEAYAPLLDEEFSMWLRIFLRRKANEIGVRNSFWNKLTLILTRKFFRRDVTFWFLI